MVQGFSLILHTCSIEDQQDNNILGKRFTLLILSRRTVSTLSIKQHRMPSCLQLSLTNLEHNHLGFDVVKFTVVDAPQDMLGAIAADPEIERVE